MSALSALTNVASKIDAVAAAAQVAGKQVVMSAEEKAKRAKIGQTAKDFESSFMNVMMQQMFEGVKTSEPFGGGQGEAMFKSVLTDAMSKQVTQAGGIGLASTIQREMLKLQGLKE
ncbi:rod-binding protein [Caulobacter sp. 1776]|uniref:rod-binding protein n=1 Tax=Caulobacter sp. 1776 TaxID=3156420 RepID=UPI00339AFD41